MKSLCCVSLINKSYFFKAVKFLRNTLTSSLNAFPKEIPFFSDYELQGDSSSDLLKIIQNLSMSHVF